MPHALCLLMRLTLLAASAAFAVACSAPASSATLDVDPANPTPTSPPTLTFVDAPLSAAVDADGAYTLGIVVSYTDDTEKVVAVSFDSADVTIDDTPMPSASSNGLTTISLELPPGTPKGMLDYAFCLVSASGLSSAPYHDHVFLE